MEIPRVKPDTCVAQSATTPGGPYSITVNLTIFRKTTTLSNFWGPTGAGVTGPNADTPACQ